MKKKICTLLFLTLIISGCSNNNSFTQEAETTVPTVDVTQSLEFSEALEQVKSNSSKKGFTSIVDLLGEDLSSSTINVYNVNKKQVNVKVVSKYNGETNSAMYTLNSDGTISVEGSKLDTENIPIYNEFITASTSFFDLGDISKLKVIKEGDFYKFEYQTTGSTKPSLYELAVNGSFMRSTTVEGTDSVTTTNIPTK